MNLGCIRQCDWDDNHICLSCGLDYSVPDSESSNDSIEQESTD